MTKNTQWSLLPEKFQPDEHRVTWSLGSFETYKHTHISHHGAKADDHTFMLRVSVKFIVSIQSIMTKNFYIIFLYNLTENCSQIIPDILRSPPGTVVNRNMVPCCHIWTILDRLEQRRMVRQYGMAWYGMVCYGMLWYGMVDTGMVGYGIRCLKKKGDMFIGPQIQCFTLPVFFSSVHC